jgi:hypothetical protein
MRLHAIVQKLMRIIPVVIAVFAAATVASAQVSVAPSSLAFGVPGNTTGVTSAAQPVVVSVSSGSATITASIAPSTNSADFAIQANTCTGTQTALAVCTISVTFTPSTSVGTLEQATLSISASEGGAFTVNLTGALGAIGLFQPVNVSNSTPRAATENVTFGNQPLNLTCPVSESGPTGMLSSSPDGSGYVLVDNNLDVAVSNASPSNVCTGGVGTNCFSSAYENDAANLAAANTDPDTIANPGTLGETGGGVAPINISSYLSTVGSTPVPVTFSLVDLAQASGNFFTSTTLFLVTNCTPDGIAPGGTISGNPVNPDNPASLVQTFPFSATPGKSILFSFNFALGQDLTNTNTAPQNTDVGFSQSTFSTMVQGTSAGPALCLHMSGELGPNNTPLCKAYVFECPDANGNLAGANCPQSVIRTLLFETKFDTVDPLTIAPGTGPGFLMGSDTWVSNSSNGPVVAACVFPSNSGFFGQLCPQDPLTEFYGADDPRPGAPVNPNSTFIPVLNMPLPFTIPLVAPWQNHTTVNVLFSAFPALYIPTPQRPANGFKPAPIASVTFGLTPASSPVPDPTFPITTDTVLFNGGGSTPDCPTPPHSIFIVSGSIPHVAEGRYQMHYFATDCATTEELNFTPNTNPSVDWASFKTVPVNVDLTAPSISLVSSSTTTSKGTTKLTVNYTCADPTLADGSPGSGVVVCGTYILFPEAMTPTLQTVFTVSGHGTKNLTATDLAGNVSTPLSVAY